MAEEYSIKTGNYFTSSKATSDVNVVGIADSAISGIVKAINSQSDVIKQLTQENDGLSNQLASLADNVNRSNADSLKRYRSEERDRKSDIVRSINADRRNRATNAALFGEVDKAISAIDVLKDTLNKALDKIGNLLKDGFSKSLQTYDDFSKEMRRMNISHEDKLKAQSAADRANIAEGLTVSKDSTVKALIIAASKNNAYFQKLINSSSKESDLRMNLMAEMQEQGFDADVMMKIITNTSDKDLKGLETLLLRTSDPESRAAAMESIRTLVNEDFESISKDVVGELTSVVDATRRASALGTNMSEKTISSFVKLSQDIKSGNIQNVDLNTLSTALGIAGDNLSNPEKLFGAIENKLSALDNLSKTDPVAAKAQADALMRELKPVLNSPDVDKDAMREFMQSISQAASGELSLSRRSIKTDEELRQTNKDNTADGKLNEFIGNLTSRFNLFTEETFGLKGGLLGNLSVNLDELFGGSVSLEDAVKSGFKAVIDLLRSIHISQMLQSAKGLLGNKLSGILPKLTGTGSKLTGVLTKIGPMLPTVGAVGIAAASLGYAAYKITDTFNKLNKPDEIKQEISKNNAQIEATENELRTAKLYGTQEEIAEVEKKLASLKAKGESLRADLQQADEDAKSDSEKAAAKWSEEQTQIMTDLIHKANQAQRFAARARQAGDEETAKIEQARYEALMDQSKEVQERMRVVDETSRGFLASAFNLEPETMLKWGTFCNDISDFFSSIRDKFRDLRQRAINAVAKFCGDTKEWVSTNITGPIYAFKDKVGSWISDNIVTPFMEIKDSVGSWISDNVVNPLINFKDTVGGFIKTKFVDPLRNFFQFNWLPGPIKDFLGINGTNNASSNTETVTSIVGSILSKFKFFEDGGVVNKATGAVVGENGKEAILPLTKPSQLKSILSSLSSEEKLKILQALVSGESLSSIIVGLTRPSGSSSTLSSPKSLQVSQANIGEYAPGDDPESIQKILSYAYNKSLVYDKIMNGKIGKKPGFGVKQRLEWYKEALQNAANQEGRELIKGTYAERALEWGVSQIGKPYILKSLGAIGYVCNELTDAALRNSGFDMKDFRIHGVGATFDKLKTGKRSKIKRGDRAGQLEEFPDFRIRDDLSPMTALPGMLFFQTAKGRTQPGHIGLVYYGHQKLHSSGGSASYDKSNFLENWQTPCRGVTVTPFDNGNYIIGELPGLFAQASGEWKPPANSPVPFGPLSQKVTNIIDSVSGATLADILNPEEVPNSPIEAASKYADAIMNSKEFDQVALQKRLARQALSAVVEMSDSKNKQLSAEYEKYATMLLNGGNIKEILIALAAIVENTREMASSNRRPVTPVSRPMNASFM